jgi:hypothetical protein
MLERLDFAAGRAAGTVCDACSTHRQTDAALKMCPRCRLVHLLRALHCGLHSYHPCKSAHRYCSVECQQMHWHLQSSVCCAKSTFLPGHTLMLHGLQQRADLNRRVALVECHVSGEGDAARRRVDPGGTEDCLSVGQSRKMSFRSL